MLKSISNLKDQLYYKQANIKNRYPCKIVKIKDFDRFDRKATITFQAVNKLNLREETVEDILADPSLMEKFHPFDTAKIGVLAMGEIALNDSKSIEEAQEKYLTIITKMFDSNEESED